MRYLFSVVHYVPDPARQEFVNVGLIVGSDDTGEWEMRTIGNRKRARALGGSLSTLATFEDYVGRVLDDHLEAMEEAEAVPVVDERWLLDLVRTQDHAVQLTAPAPISAGDIDEALDTLSSWLLIDPESGTLPYVRRTRAQPRSPNRLPHSGPKAWRDFVH